MAAAADIGAVVVVLPATPAATLAAAAPAPAAPAPASAPVAAAPAPAPAAAPAPALAQRARPRSDSDSDDGGLSLPAARVAPRAPAAKRPRSDDAAVVVVAARNGGAGGVGAPPPQQQPLTSVPPAASGGAAAAGARLPAAAAAAAAAAAPLTPDMDPYLHRLAEFFTLYGRDRSYEIEARIKNVSAVEFDAMLQFLRRSPAFRAQVETHTKDVNFGGTLRGSFADGVAPKFMHKERVAYFDAVLADGNVVRCSVSTEDVVAGELPPTLVPETVRYKHRSSFNYNGVILYELTVVHAGATDAAARAAAPEYEVELEWCGQDTPAAGWDPAYRAKSFACKIQDLLGFKRAAAAAAAARRVA